MPVRLLNAAVMPRPGCYDIRPLTPEQFAAELRRAYGRGDVESYIGYDAAARVIERVTGIRPRVSRATTPVEDGDVLLIARLRQRVADPAIKWQVGRKQDDPGAYEFFRCVYRVAAPSFRGDVVEMGHARPEQ